MSLRRQIEEITKQIKEEREKRTNNQPRTGIKTGSIERRPIP